MNDEIGKIYDKVEAEVDRMRLLVHLHAHEYAKFQRALPTFGRAVDREGMYPDVGFLNGHLHGLIVQVHLTREETFKAVVPILTWFLDEGWAQRAQYESAESGYREFSFTKDSAPPLFWREGKPYPSSLTATVRIWPHSESMNCHRVEDGTQPKYKFVCKDEEGA